MLTSVHDRGSLQEQYLIPLDVQGTFAREAEADLSLCPPFWRCWQHETPCLLHRRCLHAGHRTVAALRRQPRILQNIWPGSRSIYTDTQPHATCLEGFFLQYSGIMNP